MWIVQYVETSENDHEEEYVSDHETRIFANRIEGCRYAFNKALEEYDNYKIFCCNVNEMGRFVDGFGVKWDDSQWNTGEPNFNQFGFYNLKLRGYSDVSIVTHEVDLNTVEEEGYVI